MGFREWARERQHVLGARSLLALAERLYELAPRGDRPAIAGGRAARLVPLPRPMPFTRSERAAIRRTIRSQSTSFSDGDAIRRFEAELARALGTKHAVAVSSGTAALHAAWIALDLLPGDEVVVPALTHAASAVSVLLAGGVPRFVDVDPATWNLDPAAVESALTQRTRAILVVHLCGVPADLRALRAIADRHSLRLVEDAAQACGSRHEGRMLGAHGDVGCLSFQSAKSVTTGEGGALLTDDDAIARRARLAMNLGESRAGGRATSDLAGLEAEAELEYALVAPNYRMSGLQAALGLGQLERLEMIRERRRANAGYLAERIRGLEGLRLQSVPSGAEPNFASLFFEVESASIDRDALARGLARERIDYRLPYRKPLSAHAVFGHVGQPCPVSARICARALGLRVDPSLDRRDLDATLFALERLLAWKGGR